MKTTLVLLLLGAAVACTPGQAPAQTLRERFKSAAEFRDGCKATPPTGYIVILCRKYSDKDESGGCGFFRASRLEAAQVIRAFDDYATIRGVVVYKTTGRYPTYTKRVVEGGCPPNRKNFNCSD